MGQEQQEPRRSELHARHEKLGAIFTEEQYTGRRHRGFLVPDRYGDPDAEHMAVRSGVGVFDLSHLGLMILQGNGAAKALNAFLTNDVDRLDGPGRSQYTLACDEQGRVFEELVLHRFSQDAFMLLCGSPNWYDLGMAIEETPPETVEVRVLNDTHVTLAVEGPLAARALASIGIPVGHEDMFFEIGPEAWGHPFVNRWGISGEEAYTIIIPAEDGARLWDQLVAIGVRPCGMRAREQLRIENGRPRVAVDLVDVTANQARLGWAVAWGKPSFAGKKALEAERDAGPRRRLWGLELLGDRVIEPDGPAALTVRDGDREVGSVTSAGYSATLDRGLALALLEADIGPGAELEVEVREEGEEYRVPVKVVKPPFVTPGEE